MLIILVFVIFSVIATGEGFPRIGGVNYDISKVKYQVAVLVDDKLQCGGVIYDNDIIITAAHCLEEDVGFKFENIDKSRITICAGSNYIKKCQQLPEIVGYKKHENYEDITKGFDVAVILLKDPLQFNKKVQNIPLATHSPGAGANALVTGWGVTNGRLQTSPLQLQGVHVKIMEPEYCSELHENNTRLYLPENVICASENGKDSCGGDSGGPLVVKGKLVGIVSYGDPFCLGILGVYTDVAKYREWILDAIDEIRFINLWFSN